MTSSRLARLAVLIVDDNEHTVALVTQVLRSFGIRNITAAADGTEALAAMGERQVDLVICDWNMKPMDGLAFSTHVRRSESSPDPFVPIIMLTGHAEDALVRKARDAGIHEFLVKPISPAALLKRIRSAVEHPREFIKTKTYFGPDRRRRQMPYKGPERRKKGPKEIELDLVDAATPAARGQR